MAASAAVELYWVSGSSPLTPDPGAAGAPELGPGLLTAFEHFWGVDNQSSTDRSFSEVPLLADRAGVLTTVDLDEVIAGLGRAATGVVGDPTLASEPAGDRAVIVERLGRLRAGRSLRRAWLDLLAEAAAALRPRWEQTGLEVSRRAARARASQLPWSDPIDAVVTWARRDYDGLLPRLLADAARRSRPVLVVPAYWSGRGLLFDLDEHLLVGIPAQLGPADSRARTEPWVRGLKALADPTRLAMLDHLVGTPRRISDLAADFGVAQPTASRHARLLREAGLVREVRHGSSAVMTVDTVALGCLLDGLADAFASRLGAPATAPEEQHRT